MSKLLSGDSGLYANNIDGRVMHGDTEYMRQMLHNGAPVESCQCDTTPLICAAKWGYVGKVKLLLEYNANVSATRKNGETPLHLAARACDNSLEVVMLLIDAGADPSVRDHRGMTPLMRAAQTLWGVDPMVLDVLLRGGAYVNASDNNGWTALHYAVNNGLPAIYHGLSEVVDILLKHGANVMAMSNDGRTVGDMLDDNNDIHEFRARINEAIERVRNEAFAMGQHERLGSDVFMRELGPDVVRMILHPDTLA
jgi:hypothetical protein